MHSMSLGKAFVLWLLAIVVEVLNAETRKEFLKSSRVGSKAFIVQRHANRNGRYLVIGEYGGGGRRSSIIIPEGREGKGWYEWVIELQKVATFFNVSDSGGRRGGTGGSSQPSFGKGYGDAHSGRTFCWYASTKIEVGIPATRKPEQGLEALQWLYKEALVCRTRFHAPSIDEAGMLVRMTSYKGGTGEDSAKICTNDFCHKGCVVEGEKAPFCCCRYLRTQLELMREEMDRMVKKLNAGLGLSRLARRMVASTDASLGHSGSGYLARPEVFCDPRSEFGPTPCTVFDIQEPFHCWWANQK